MKITLLMTLLLFASGCDCLPIVQRTYRFMDNSECALGQTTAALAETNERMRGMEQELRAANQKLEVLNLFMKRLSEQPRQP